MSHEHGHDCCGAPSNPFTQDEVLAFQAQDYQAAKGILLLLLSIFTMGLIGYAAVALWVA
jgi:hypothetical protein